MRLYKKGISPLIATVLIIGFTVALAAIIMTWGTTFSKSMQKGTESTTEEQLACAQELEFEVTSVCHNKNEQPYPNNLTMTIKNNKAKDIERLQVRIYQSKEKVGTFVLPKLARFDIYVNNSVQHIDIDETQVRFVEAIPIIKVGEKELTCSTAIDTFGSFDDPAEIPACA